MQVTDEMVDTLCREYQRLDPHVWLMRNEMRQALQAMLDAMPKATGGIVPGPAATSDHLHPRLADVTPPEKVRRAAAAVPGITFNLNQQYGGLDEAARRKMLQDLRLDVRGTAAQADDDSQEPQGADG